MAKYIQDGFRLHLYWWGIYFGVYALLSIVFALSGIKFFAFPSFITALTGPTVFLIDSISEWHGTFKMCIAIRLLASTFTTILLGAFNGFLYTPLWQTLLWDSLSWVLYVAALLYFYVYKRIQPRELAMLIRAKLCRLPLFPQHLYLNPYIKDAFRLHLYWWGIFFGFFYMPAIALTACTEPIFIFLFVWSTSLTGFVMPAIMPVHTCHGTFDKTIVVRLLTSSLTTVLLIAFHTLTLGDFGYMLVWCSVPWGIFTVALVSIYLNERLQRYESSDKVKNKTR